MDWLINDKSINETEIIAYAWGQVGVPLIFASGDNKLEKQLSYMTWLQFVTVKYAKGFSDVELRPLAEVYQDFKASAKKAVKNIRKCKAIKPTLPIKAQLRAVPPASLSLLEGVPGINCKDNTVTFEAAGKRKNLKKEIFWSTIKSFCGGPGGGFFKKSPLAAGGKVFFIVCLFKP
jgi:D-aminopeptidase